MILADFPRSLAILLLRFAIWIAPQDTHDWGRGMLSELNHMEGNWSALLWSLGGAGVLAKHAVLALILPGGHRRTVSSASELFDKELPMRRATLTATAACVAASLLFFLAPVFRQAFRVSLAQWHYVLYVRAPFTEQSDPVLKDLLRKAEQNHDAEALAFVALRTWDRSESARLADEAVRLDPNLTWVYASAGTFYLPSSNSDCISALEHWDPQNALPHLIVAQEIGETVTHSKEFPLGKAHPNPGWQDAMEAAFQSPKLDTYVDLQKNLDRRVLARYHVDDPFQVVSYGDWYGLPSYASWYSSSYAESLLDAGKSFEARGDRKAALDKYWTIARFSQLMGANREFFMRKQLKEAYARLATLSQLEGNKAGAAYYAALADQLDKSLEDRLIARRNSYLGSDVSHWNAFLVRLSGLLILSFGALLALCAIGVVIRSRSIRLTSLRPSGLTLALGCVAAVGALLASSILFASYWPYSHALQRFVSAGDEAGLSDLANFLGNSQLPLGSGLRIGSWYVGVGDTVFYFWFSVTILCALALLIALVRHVQTRPRGVAA
ncbi:MAG TPA: hypothetical protein VNH65_06765 [Candidatus Acidoferrum sp.]|nr:hypothetical protein [Candidatus Acidoferrum sp.]